MLTGAKVIHLCEEVAGDKSTGALLMKERGLRIEKRRDLMSITYIIIINKSSSGLWLSHESFCQGEPVLCVYVSELAGLCARVSEECEHFFASTPLYQCTTALMGVFIPLTHTPTGLVPALPLVH